MLHPWTPVTLVMSQDSGSRVEVLVFEPTSLVVVSVLGPAMNVPTNQGGFAAAQSRVSCLYTWASDECPHKPGWVRGQLGP